MHRFLILTLVLGTGMSAVNAVAASDPFEAVRQSEQVLSDLISIPGRQIPHRLLAQAQGVAIIPNVTKIGFIAGVRRGHGVLMVRDAEGEWSLPQFLTLTGGSVGWQAGIQATDVVLIFNTRKGVDGLMKGKFTIGADASVSAGPIGREAEAATDLGLRTEIYSYSRSRGLFLGVSVEGSALEIDHFAHAEFYGSNTVELPRRLPQSAAQLRDYLTELTRATPAMPAAGGNVAPPVQAPRKLEALRRSLIHHNGQLQAILNPAWRQYLALPGGILEPAGHVNPDALAVAQQHFAEIERLPNYRDLADRPEFKATHELLREYANALSTSGPTLQLPPPPPVLPAY